MPTPSPDEFFTTEDLRVAHVIAGNSVTLCKPGEPNIHRRFVTHGQAWFLGMTPCGDCQTQLPRSVL